MLEQINEIIEKNLPKQVGENLQKVLKKAEEDEAHLKKQLNINLDLANEIKKLISEKSALEDKLSKHKSLDKREKELIKKETQFKVDTLTYQLEVEKYKSQFCKVSVKLSHGW